MKIILYITLIVTMLLSSCSGSASNKAAKGERPTKFEMPTIPSMLTTPEQRAEYLAKHYWDNFDFGDTSLISNVEVTEQGFSDFINILPITTPDIAGEALKSMIARSEVDSAMFAHFAQLSEKYLYDPNSPFRNDELYIPVLEAVIASPKLDDTEKIRPRYLLETALKNRVGAKATNFNYTLGNGSQGNLYSIKSDNVILFFYHPECHTCRDIREAMEQNPLLNMLLESGKLKILAMYTDPDPEIWRKYQSNISKQWINGYDKEQILNPKKIYDLKASPTIYLLDQNKTVLLKDVNLDVLVNYLAGTNAQQ